MNLKQLSVLCFSAALVYIQLLNTTGWGLLQFWAMLSIISSSIPRFLVNLVSPRTPGIFAAKVLSRQSTHTLCPGVHGVVPLRVQDFVFLFFWALQSPFLQPVLPTHVLSFPVLPQPFLCLSGLHFPSMEYSFSKHGIFLEYERFLKDEKGLLLPLRNWLWWVRKASKCLYEYCCSLNKVMSSCKLHSLVSELTVSYISLH